VLVTATTPKSPSVSRGATDTVDTLLPGHPLAKTWALEVDTSEDDAPDDDGIPDVEADPYGIGPIWDKYKPMRIGRRRVACALDDLKPTNFAIVRAPEDAPDDGFFVTLGGHRCWVLQVKNRRRTEPTLRPLVMFRCEQCAR
jgi:hypothetical protein